MGSIVFLKNTGILIGLGLFLPVVFLFNAFVIPEPYSHPLINVAIFPLEFIPIMENREFVNEMTIFIFGRMTANNAPLGIIILIVIWFVISVLFGLFLKNVYRKYKNT